MISKILKNKSILIKIIHIILFIITTLYILECIFIRGLFTNAMLAWINIVLSVVTFMISLIKKEYKLAVIDFTIFSLISSIFIYLIYNYT